MNPERIKIKTDSRYIRQSASFAIRDVYDALVEIITNCDDSYHRLYRKGARPKDGGDILISVEQHRNKPSLVSVADKAEGLTRDAMRTNFGTRGKRTSEKGDRGFMARGIKDCAVLGPVTVESICDGMYCKCVLITVDDLDLHHEDPASPNLRKKLGINKNGTVVTLECKKTKTRVPKAETIARDLSMHYALRDILAVTSNARVRVRMPNAPLKTVHSSETPYSGTPVYNKKIELEGYPGFPCELKIWKHEKALKDATDPRMRESGILIKGARGIYDCSLFRYESDAKHYAGRLECPQIEDFLVKFHTDEEDVFLIDPNRQTGLSRGHPFAKKLIEKVETVLGDLVAQEKAEKGKKAGSIANAEIGKCLNKLARAADKLWKDALDDDEELSDSEGSAIDAVNKLGVYILPPKFKIKVGEKRSLTVYTTEPCYNRKRKIRVESSDPKTLKVVKQFDRNDKLRPHMKQDGIYYGSIDVAACSIGSATITVHTSKTASATAAGEVVHGKSEDIHVFPEGVSLEFERKNYRVYEGKRKMLKIFVKKPNRQRSSPVVNVNSNKPDYVEVLGNRKFQPNYASGQSGDVDVRVEGRKLTDLNRPATVIAKMGNETAKATVTVVEKKSSSGKFEIDLTSENLGHYRARWADIENKPNLLKISAVHPSIRHYFGDAADDFPGQESSAARAIMAELVTENICIKILQAEVEGREGGFNFANQGFREVLGTIVERLQKKVGDFSVKAHQIMNSGQSAK